MGSDTERESASRVALSASSEVRFGSEHQVTYCTISLLENAESAIST